MLSSRYHTTADVAEQLNIDAPAVLKLIGVGELVAHDVAMPGSRSRRWRIAPADLDAFLTRRRSQPPPKRQVKPRRKQEAVVAYY